MKAKITSHNLKLRGVGDQIDLWNKVMKEVRLKRYAGPFTDIPFKDHCIQLPIGLVPKDNQSDTRLIFHLPHPCGTGMSVNENTPDHFCTVKYPEFEDAILLCLKEGKNCKIAQSDMKAAFRNVCIRKQDFWLLILKCKNPRDNKVYYFVDKCLPFGHSISCKLFQEFSNSIAHVVMKRTGKQIINYLDDYMFSALFKFFCNAQVREFLTICEYIAFPVNLDKTFWGTMRLVFLGLLIDMVLQMVFTPIEKVHRALDMIKTILENKSKKMTVLQLQKVCGFLNFLCKCIILGWAFMRRLYSYTSTVHRELKPHHHIAVNAEIRRDLTMWKEFLLTPEVYSTPFIQFDKAIPAEEVFFFTDASGAIGMGRICNESWMIQQRNLSFLINQRPSIEYLELFALVAAILLWIDRFKNRKIAIFCDNQTVCGMVENMTTLCKQCMVLVRMLVFKCMEQNVMLSTHYVKSTDNELTDHLSRGRINEFICDARKAGKKVKKSPTPVPEIMWPPEKKVWIY